MKEGNNVLCGEDIVEGTKGRLRGTHVYPIEINRGADRQLQKPLVVFHSMEILNIQVMELL